MFFFIFLQTWCGGIGGVLKGRRRRRMHWRRMHCFAHLPNIKGLSMQNIMVHTNTITKECNKNLNEPKNSFQTHLKSNPTMRQILLKGCYKSYYNDLKIKKRSYQVCRRHRSHKWGIHWLATYLQLSYLDSIHSNLKFLRFKFTIFF